MSNGVQSQHIRAGVLFDKSEKWVAGPGSLTPWMFNYGGFTFQETRGLDTIQATFFPENVESKGDLSQA